MTVLGMKMIRLEEGVRFTPYTDSKGYLTIGYGHKLRPDERFTRINMDTALDLFLKDYNEAKLNAEKLLGGVNLPAPIKAVVVSMCFQMGYKGVLGFKKALAALKRQDFDEAAKELLDSKWAREDSPARADRHAWQVEKGKWHPYYMNL